MPSVNVYFQADISLPGADPVTIGSKSVPVTIALDATAPDAHRSRYYIANNAEQQVLAVGSGLDLPAFKLAFFKPSAVMMLGWRGASSDADNSAVELRAGAWFMLTNDATVVYNAATATRIDNAATQSDISAVYAGNESGATAYIDVVAVY